MRSPTDPRRGTYSVHGGSPHCQLRHLWSRTVNPIYPHPRIDDRTRPYWEGAAAGELRLYLCLNCRRYSFPADYQCTCSNNPHGQWVSVSGEGTIYSFCTFHKAYWPELKDQLPYTVIQVRLREGPFLYSRLSGKTKPRIGMPVRACFKETPEKLTLVLFTNEKGDF